MNRARLLLPALLAVTSSLGCDAEDAGDPAPLPEATHDGSGEPQPAEPRPLTGLGDHGSEFGSGDGLAAPLAGPTQSSFAGRYSGDDLTLELVGTDELLRGTMAFRGDSYPVRARVAPDGTLEGSFETKGRSYGLRAIRQGERVELTSSNRTYLLSPQPTEDLLASWVAAGKPTPGFSGLWVGTHAGRPASLEVREAGGRLTGTLSCGGRRYVVSAQRTAVSASGVVEDPASGTRYTIELLPADRRLRVWLSSAGPLRQVSLQLERAEAGQ